MSDETTTATVPETATVTTLPQESDTPAVSDLTPEAQTKELERARREAASYREKLRKAEEAAELARTTAEREKMTEVERLKAEIADNQALLEKARADAIMAQRLAALTGKVTDAKAALKLLEEDQILEDGSINMEAFIAAYPFLSPKTGPASINPTNATNMGKTLTMADVRKMTPAEINDRWDEIKNLKG